MNASQTSLRHLRALRAAQKWVEEGGDLQGIGLAVIEAAVVDEANMRGACGLTPAEVDAICRQTVTAHVLDRAQRDAEAAADAAADAPRLAYLAKVRADLLLTRDDRRPRPTASPRS